MEVETRSQGFDPNPHVHGHRQPRRSDISLFLDSETTTVDGSHSMMPLRVQTLTSELKAQYLLTLPAIRDRCSQVHDLAKEGKLEYFEYHPGNEEQVADFCLEI